MQQSDLNRAVARATGETVSTIQRLGFLLADTDGDLGSDDDDHGPNVIDWDQLAAHRFIRTVGNPPYEPATM